MTDESAIDREVAQAIRLARTSDKYLWWAAYKVWKVCVCHRVQAVEVIAQAVGRDRSRVEDWIHGYQVFRDLPSTGVDSRTLRRLRGRLTLSHYIAAWELRNKYGLNDADVYAYLSDSVAYGYSAAQLRREADAHEEKHGRVATWKFIQPRIRRWYAVAVQAEGTPPAVLEWLADAPDEVKE